MVVVHTQFYNTNCIWLYIFRWFIYKLNPLNLNGQPFNLYLRAHCFPVCNNSHILSACILHIIIQTTVIAQTSIYIAGGRKVHVQISPWILQHWWMKITWNVHRCFAVTIARCISILQPKKKNVFNQASERSTVNCSPLKLAVKLKAAYPQTCCLFRLKFGW